MRKMLMLVIMILGAALPAFSGESVLVSQPRPPLRAGQVVEGTIMKVDREARQIVVLPDGESETVALTIRDKRIRFFKEGMHVKVTLKAVPSDSIPAPKK